MLPYLLNAPAAKVWASLARVSLARGLHRAHTRPGKAAAARSHARLQRPHEEGDHLVIAVAILRSEAVGLKQCVYFTGLRSLRLIKVAKPDHQTTFCRSTDHLSDGHRWGSLAGPDRVHGGPEGSERVQKMCISLEEGMVIHDMRKVSVLGGRIVSSR